MAQFLTCTQAFKLADNYFVISEHKSILGGLFDRTVLKFKKVWRARALAQPARERSSRLHEHAYIVM